MVEGAAQIRLVNLVKRYGDVTAVENVSLEVMRGEFLTLLGPSGSGKTTTLMMIAGLIVPTAGQIYLGGREVSLLSPNRRDIGVVFQNYALFPHMTVFDNVAFPLEMRRLPKRAIAERVGATLEIVRLEGLSTRYPTQLSGGQQQRVALARALVFEPSVLLMDEPLGALDKKLREHMQLELKHLQKSLHLTVLYVTHDQQEALIMSDRVAVMHHGRIEQVGCPDDLYERPASRLVADFIGESNFLTGIIQAVDEDTCYVFCEPGLGITATARSQVGVGAKVNILVRPERIYLDECDLTLSNCFEGSIREAIYIGEARRYTVEVKGATFIVKKPNIGGAPLFQTGDAVKVRWSAADCLLLPTA